MFPGRRSNQGGTGTEQHHPEQVDFTTAVEQPNEEQQNNRRAQAQLGRKYAQTRVRCRQGEQSPGHGALGIDDELANEFVQIHGYC